MQSLHGILILILTMLVAVGVFVYTTSDVTPGRVLVKATEVDIETAYSAYKSLETEATFTLQMDGGDTAVPKGILSFLSSYVKTVSAEDVPETITATVETQNVSPFSPSLAEFPQTFYGSGLVSVSSNVVDGTLRLEVRSVDDRLFVRFFDLFTFTNDKLQGVADEYINLWLSADEGSLLGLGDTPLASSFLSGGDTGAVPGPADEEGITLTEREVREVQRAGAALVELLIDNKVIVPSFTETSNEDMHHIAFSVNTAHLQEALNHKHFERKVIEPALTALHDPFVRAVADTMRVNPETLSDEEKPGRKEMRDILLEMRDAVVEFVDARGEDISLSGAVSVDTETLAIPSASFDMRVVLEPSSEGGRMTEIDVTSVMTFSEQEVTLEVPHHEKKVSDFLSALFLQALGASLGGALFPQ